MRNKVQSIIQIASLAMGLTVFTMIVLYLYDEFTMDRSNEHFSQVYRVENHKNVSPAGDALPLPVGPLMKENVPEITAMTRILSESTSPVSYIEEPGKPARQIELSQMYFVDSGFQDVFPQEYLLGDALTSLDDPYSIVLVESAAKKIFGGRYPLGQTLYVWNSIPATVTGVIRDPLNSHLRMEALSTMKIWFQRSRANGYLVDDQRQVMLNAPPAPTYICLHEDADRRQVRKKIEESWRQVMDILAPDVYHALEITLTSLKDVHFTDIEPYRTYMSNTSRRDLVNFFLLGLGILLLGIINYMNLATARASKRSREFAIRRIVGSSRSRLILFYLVESVITTFFAFLVAVTILQLFFHRFNNLLEADIGLHFLRSSVAWVVSLACIIIIGVMAGIIPAIQMSSRSALAVFEGPSTGRGKSLAAGMGHLTRRILMIVQFSSSTILLIGILFMQIQIRYMQDQDLGFDTEKVVWTGTGAMSKEKRMELLSRLERYPEIKKACLSNPVPGLFPPWTGAPVEDPNSVFHGLSIEFWKVGPEFFDVYDLEFLYGEDFLDQVSTKSYFDDSSGASSAASFIINESLMKVLDMEDPVGRQMGPNSYIMGVIKDFHSQSLRYPIKPMLLELSLDGDGWWLSMKINSLDINRTFRQIEEEYHEVAKTDLDLIRPAEVSPAPLMFHFIDDTFNEQYNQLLRIRTASVYLSILALIIAFLGLFGLVTFMAQRRTRELVIRKVFGASSKMAFRLLAVDFLKWVSVSLIIGLPLGWFLMGKWQQQFAYRADIGIWIYVCVALSVFIISMGAIAWQSLRAARTRPVDALRHE